MNNKNNNNLSDTAVNENVIDKMHGNAFDKINESTIDKIPQSIIDKIPEDSKISITGDLGSGKSTVSNVVREKYGYAVYSTGAVQRALAEKYGMTTLQFNKYMETHTEIDEEIDTKLTEIGKQPGRIIIDSRMAWHFVPHSYKVFLTVALDTAALRIMNAQRGSVESYSSLEDAKTKLLQRKSSENLRYSQKYGVNCADMGNFDLVIDTTDKTPEAIADLIIINMLKDMKVL